MIEINKLTKTYENGFAALRGVSLTTGERGMLAIVGSSGSGKSTLLNVLACNDTFEEGSATYNGKPYGELTQEEKSANFAYIYQDYKLIENITVSQNLKISAELAGCADDNAINAVLAQVGLDDKANEPVLNLSGGQKQRVAIARAIIRNPKVIFADEPTGNLDSENSTAIFQLLNGLCSKMLVIVVTHDVEEVSKYADRIVTIKDGKFLSDTALPTENATAQSTESAQSSGQSTTQTNSQGEQSTAKNTQSGQNTAQNTAQTTESAQSSEPTTARPTKRCGKLSSGSVACLARSFNPYKKAKSVLLLTIMSIVMVLTLVASSFATMTYDKAVAATLKKTEQSQSEMILRNHRKNDYNQELSDLQDFLATEMNIESGKVFRMSEKFGYSFDIFRAEIYDKNGNDISMFNASVTATGQQKIVLCDDLASIGVKLVSGKAPTADNECVIPLSYMQALLSQTFRIGDDFDSRIAFADEQAVFAHTFGKMKIVGVFDDFFTSADEYKQISMLGGEAPANPKNTLQRLSTQQHNDALQRLQKMIRNNFLTNYIFMSESNQKFLDDIEYLDFVIASDRDVQLACELQNNIVSIAPKLQAPLCFAPFNQNTARWNNKISATEINKGEIWVSSAFLKNYVNQADRSAIEVGDTANLRLTRGWYDKTEFPGDSFAYASDQRNFKAFKIAGVYDDDMRNVLFFNDEDLQSMRGDYHTQGEGIFFDQKELGLSDLTKIRKFCADNYSVPNIYQTQSIEYIHANSNGLKNATDEAALFSKYFAIPVMILLIILLAFLVVNDMSNAFKFKAHELLVLKSLGAKKIDIAKVFGLFSAFVIVLELVCGLGLGALAIQFCST